MSSPLCSKELHDSSDREAFSIPFKVSIQSALLDISSISSRMHWTSAMRSSMRTAPDFYIFFLELLTGVISWMISTDGAVLLLHIQVGILLDF